MRRKARTAGVLRRIVAVGRLTPRLLFLVPALVLLVAGAPATGFFSPAEPTGSSSSAEPTGSSSPAEPTGFSSSAEPTEEELRRAVSADRADVDARKRLSEILGASDLVEDRREAVELLSEALLADETDPDLWVRLARLQTRRGFKREARLAYARALEIAPERADLWSEMAAHELRRFQHYHRDPLFAAAVKHNDHALGLEPENLATVARAARLAAIAGDRARLDSLCIAWNGLDESDPWPHLLRGMMLTEAGAWNRARRAYDAGLSRLDPEARRSFLDLSAVDPLAEELRVIAPDTTRYWEDFWRWRDPTPADADNPRLMEHYRRLVQAELYFGQEGAELSGWDHAPGRTVIRYGLPNDWVYLHHVVRVSDYKVTSTFAVPAISVRFGHGGHPLHFTFVDYSLSGHFYHPISGGPSAADFLMVESPSFYVPPFQAPELDQEIELWRFRDPAGGGRIEVAVALPPELWPEGLIAEPHRLASQMTLYDEQWETQDATVASWAQFETDHLGRLVGIFRLDAAADSAIVGIETRDRLETGRAVGYATLPPDSTTDLPALSDIAFVSRVGFDDAEGRYGRAYGSALPNPGHRYEPGQPLGIAFEAYGLELGDDGEHRARIRVTVGRLTTSGWIRVLLRQQGDTPEAELVFDTSEPGTTLEQLLAVDLPRLRSGEYTLRVEVEDLIGGTAVDATAPFTVMARARNHE